MAGRPFSRWTAKRRANAARPTANWVVFSFSSLAKCPVRAVSHSRNLDHWTGRVSEAAPGQVGDVLRPCHRTAWVRTGGSALSGKKWSSTTKNWHQRTVLRATEPISVHSAPGHSLQVVAPAIRWSIRRGASMATSSVATRIVAPPAMVAATGGFPSLGDGVVGGIIRCRVRGRSA
jgi:hypothetical protein